MTIEDLIEAVSSVAVLVGGNGFGPWHEAEMRAFLCESITRGIPVIPVLLPSAPVDATLPLFLRQFMWVDCRDGLTKSNIDRLMWGITGKKGKAKKQSEKRVSAKATGLRVGSKFLKRGSRIPFKVFQGQSYEHYNLQVYLDGPKAVLDAVVEVEYQLHEAFKRPRRVSTDRLKRFVIAIWAYGGFDMHANIRFEDGTICTARHTVDFALPDDDGTNYVYVKSRQSEAEHAGCDDPD